jgi:hypothetical protein
MAVKIRTTKNVMKKAGQLRRSQTVTTFGCGSIVDFPRLSGIMSGIDSWFPGAPPEEVKIYQHDLEQMLGKDFFVQVSSPDHAGEYSFGLPVFRFPRMYYCPKCHMLDRYNWIRKQINNTTEYNSDLYCKNCSTSKNPVKLIPSRFIVSCLNGHIDDFPYAWWVHRKKGMCENPILSLEYKGTTGGLDSIHISCKCGAHSTMEGCMNNDAFLGLKCRGTMPWLGLNEEKKWYTDPEECHAQLRTLQRSENNVYYPVNQSALTIPPWSDNIHKVINKYRPYLELILSDDDEDNVSILLHNHFKMKADEYKCSEDIFIKEVFRNFRGEENAQEITEQTLRINEYKAFCLSDVDNDYFKTVTTNTPSSFSSLIAQVKLVKRLREVMVLQGFRRILPSYETDETKRKELGIFDREFAPISRQPKNWLPAIELFGEGIFIQFNEEAVCDWENRNASRYLEMSKRLEQNWIGNDMFSQNSPRFVFLHTFAHLLIRQLASQCGYATASLKEKIYSTYEGTGEPMCGILIYTAATDSDGSLGGLVREGNSDRLENTIHALLQEASWCSNDPVCIDSKSQGFNSLNYASCHACLLLPETSCESVNCLLDRASVVGTPDDKSIAFFKDFI